MSGVPSFNTFRDAMLAIGGRDDTERAYKLLLRYFEPVRAALRERSVLKAAADLMTTEAARAKMEQERDTALARVAGLEWALGKALTATSERDVAEILRAALAAAQKPVLTSEVRNDPRRSRVPGEEDRDETQA